jgi:hypothetical protein
MSKPKRTAKRARTSRPKPAPSPAPTAASPGPDQLLARLPALDGAHRNAYLGQFSEADCAALGAQTKSAAVRAGALAWAAEATPALASPALAPEIDYAPERLAWLVELIVRLDAARGESGRSGARQSSVRTVRDVAREKAWGVRKRLAGKLSRVVRGDPIATVALADAGSAPSDDDLLGSLGILASLADRVTQSTEPSVLVLAASARVAAADATGAREAMAALKAASRDVALGGRAQGERDTPAVNVVEGRVLFELLFLRDAFDDARRRGVAVPALVPPTGLRHVLAHSRPKKAASPPTSPGSSPA